MKYKDFFHWRTENEGKKMDFLCFSLCMCAYISTCHSRKIYSMAPDTIFLPWPVHAAPVVSLSLPFSLSLSFSPPLSLLSLSLSLFLSLSFSLFLSLSFSLSLDHSLVFHWNEMGRRDISGALQGERKKAKTGKICSERFSSASFLRDSAESLADTFTCEGPFFSWGRRNRKGPEISFSAHIIYSIFIFWWISADKRVREQSDKNTYSGNIFWEYFSYHFFFGQNHTNRNPGMLCTYNVFKEKVFWENICYT